MPGLPDVTKIGKALPNGSLWQGINIDPIPFSKEMSHYIQTEVSTMLSCGDPLTYLVGTGSSDSVRAEIKRFGIALHAYLTTPGTVMSYGFLIQGITDYKFAENLKKIRSKAIIGRSGGNHDAYPGDDFFDLPSFCIRDVGDIFNYKYWFNWKLEPAGDIEYHHIPVEIDDEPLARFTSSVRKLVKEVLKKGKVFLVPEEAISTTLSSSSCVQQHTGKRSKVWKEKENHNGFSSDPLVGYVTYVQKGPCELREAVTLTVEQSNSVRLIEKQVYYVVRNMRYSAYHAEPETFERRFKRFYDDHTAFFNRDLTKEGITKPRKLVQYMLKVLSEEIPGAPAWKYKGIYDNFYYVDTNGVKHSTKRGHGLGMANALTTLMQCAAFDAYLDTIDLDRNRIDALFFNDDSSIGADNSETLDVYTDAESDFLSSLGLLPKGTKTWNGRVAVLCERYYPEELNNKQSYKNYARCLPFSAPCILNAKSMSNLTLDPSYGEPRWDLFERLIQFFGTESGDLNEVITPYSCGGWLNIKYAGVDCSFLDYDDPHPPLFMSRGAYVGAPRLKPEFFSKEKGVYLSPVEKLYPIPELPEVLERRMLIRRPRREISALFSRNKNEAQLTRWLKKQVEERQVKWTVRSPYLSWRELITKVSETSDYDVLPPRSYISFRDNDEVSIPGSGRFESPDPVNSVRWFYQKEIPLDLRTVPWPVYDPGQAADVTSSKIAQSESKNMFLPKGHPVLQRAPYVNDRVLLRRDWKDSYKVWKIWIALTGNPTYPINPWPSGIAALHKEFEIYEAHIEKWWAWYQESDELGWKHILLMIQNPDLIDEILDEPDPIPEQINPDPGDQPGYEFDDFDQWYFSGRPWVDHPLYEVWLKGADALQTSLESITTAETLGDIRASGRNWPSTHFANEGEKTVITNLCHLVEEEHKYGFATYRFKSTDLLSGSDGAGLFDFFDEG